MQCGAVVHPPRKPRAMDRAQISRQQTTFAPRLPDGDFHRVNVGRKYLLPAGPRCAPGHPPPSVPQGERPPASLQLSTGPSIMSARAGAPTTSVRGSEPATRLSPQPSDPPLRRGPPLARQIEGVSLRRSGTNRSCGQARRQHGSARSSGSCRQIRRTSVSRIRSFPSVPCIVQVLGRIPYHIATRWKGPRPCSRPR